MKRLFLVVFFFEVGIVLAVAPWSRYWEANYFAEAVPAVRPLLMNAFVRGAVTGVGLINFAAGIAEFLSVAATRRYAEPIVTIAPSSVVEE